MTGRHFKAAAAVVLAVLAVFAAITVFTACKNETSTGEKGKTLPVPAAADFNISGTGSYKYDGSPKIVTVTAKEGKTTGAVTVKYRGSAAAPSEVGAYPVTFDVEAAKGWNAAKALSAGDLTITQVYTVTFNSNGGTEVAPIGGLSGGEKITEPAPPVKTGTVANVFEGWYDQALVTPFDFNTPITGNITLYAKWDFPYKLGGTGPGGGKIFYRSEAGFAMTDNGSTAHYLEAAPADMPAALQWASTSALGGTLITGMNPTAGTSSTAVTDTTKIGAGRKNTALILDTDAAAPAAKSCGDYANNGVTDWFLPSLHELNELYDNRAFIGNLGTNHYWSSTQYDYLTAWQRRFIDGGDSAPEAGNKFGSGYSTCQVRAIRAF